MEYPLRFPFVECRHTDRDRRSGMDRRQNSVEVESDLRGLTDRRASENRRQWRQDRDKMLRDIRFPSSGEPESRATKYLRLLLLPVVIALGSVSISYFISVQQIKSANIIAEQQRKSARLIADSQLENSAEIAEARVKTQKLAQMLVVFTAVLTDLSKPAGGGSGEYEILRKKIASLEVYRDDALNFLLQLRDYDSSGSGSTATQRNYQVAADTARETIHRILRKSQPDFSGLTFESDNSTPLNLRNREYVGYNMSDSVFSNVNLFNTDFTESTLVAATFRNVDLVRANFKGANLQDVTFDGVDVLGVNFVGANLADVHWDKVRNIGDAKFSVYVLLRADGDPAKLMTDRELLTALSAETDRLKKIQRETPDKFKALYQRLNLRDFEALRERLDEVLAGAVDGESGDTGSG